MSIESDFHNHIVRSSAEEMIQRAKEKQLRVFGLSEHAFQMKEIHPLLTHMPLEGPLLTLDEYFEQIHMAMTQVQLDVRIGLLEVDFIPSKNAEIQQVLQGRQWDFLIGSVHEVDGILFENEHNLSQKEGEALWLRYFELLREAVNSGCFCIVSHPVRMGYANPFLPVFLDKELEQLAADATHQNTALEINGFDVLTYPNLVSRLAYACVVHRTPISVGSDAHYSHKIAQGHQASFEILREVGIEKVRTWKQMDAEDYTI